MRECGVLQARGERHPMQFGRQVVAKLLGAPERADWKECRVDREAEEARALLLLNVMYQSAHAMSHRVHNICPLRGYILWSYCLLKSYCSSYV